jgi:hypothetical protein
VTRAKETKKTGRWREASRDMKPCDELAMNTLEARKISFMTISCVLCYVTMAWHCNSLL